jgi:hypothetical protein
MRAIIGGSPGKLKEDALFKDPPIEREGRRCRTFVLATRPEGSGRSSVRMRTYATTDSDPFDAEIWKVARATSAAPTYFLPIEIGGIKYGDGRTGWNNPAAEAKNEAECVWPDRPIGCLISLGAGLEDAIQLYGVDQSPDDILGSMVEDATPKEVFEIAVAQYCVNCAISCERTHEDVSRNWNRHDTQGKYFRLNVPQGMAKIGLQEWEKLTTIAALTYDYMESSEIQQLKREIAKQLRDPDSVESSPEFSHSQPERLRTVQRQIEGPLASAYM